MIKGSIQEKNITLVNVYAPNIGAPKYIQQILTDIKGEIDGNAIIVDFNIPLTSMERSSRQKINKATEILNDIIKRIDLIFLGHYIQKTDYTFFSRNILKERPYTGA